MSYFEPIDLKIFNLGDLGTFQSRDVTEAIANFQVSLTMSQSSQISVSVIDAGFEFAKANYFQIRRDIFYRNLWFEISAVQTERSESIHPVYGLECRSKAVQLMKRDKKPEAYRGMAAFDFAQAVAKRFALNFVGERTTKKQSIVKGKNKNSDDSVWTVLTGLAQEQQFLCFESEGTLFFCSEKFLIGKWGDPNFTYGDFKFIPFFYPETNDPVFASVKDKYILLEQPSLRRSDDDIRAAEGSMLVDRANGVNLRPGMTIFLGGIPDFESFYIITDVSFQEGVPDPVQVQFRVPVDPNKESVSSGGTSSSSTTTGNTGQTNSISGTPGQEQSQGNKSSSEPLNPQKAREYAGRALQYAGYRGSNGNLIKAAVQTAVLKLVNKIPLDTIWKGIRETVGLTTAEKDLAQQIYAHYALGLPASKLGVAGGLTADSAERRFAQVESEYKQPDSNVTPSRVSTTSTVPADRIEQQIESGTKLPGNVASLIRLSINNALPTTSPQARESLIKKAIDDAFRIFKTPGAEGKLDRYNTLYQGRNYVTGTGFSIAQWHAKYNAVRQDKVVDQLDKTLRRQAGFPPRLAS